MPIRQMRRYNCVMAKMTDKQPLSFGVKKYKAILALALGLI